MSRWHYAQLVVAIDEHRPDDEAQTMLWQGPHQEPAENISPGGQTITQLLNRFGADGWELIAVQEQRSGGARSFSFRDPLCALTTYTIKRPAAPGSGG